MSAFFHDVAGASLPVAIGLLILAATARALLWAQIDAPATRRIARQYVEPLCTWCLVALSTNVVATVAAGDAGVGTLTLPVLLGLAAGVLRVSGERPAPATPGAPRRPAPTAPATPRTTPAPTAPATPRTTPAPTASATTRTTPPPAGAAAAPPTGSLWADPADDESAPRAGLWSRA